MRFIQQHFPYHTHVTHPIRLFYASSQRKGSIGYYTHDTQKTTLQKMRILVTGGKGFIGSELVAYLYAQGHEVSSPNRSELELTNSDQVSEYLNQFKPNQIYHLAGISRVNDSLGMPDYFASNTTTTLTLLKGLQSLSKQPDDKPIKFFFASSMHIFGNQTEEVSESTPPQPLSYYAFTKYLSEQVILKGSSSTPYIHYVIGRLYSCFGPKQPDGFVASDLIRKILELEDKPNAVLKIGPLNTYRRFVDVRDACQIIYKLMLKKHPTPCEIFNLASPHELQIREILDLLLQITGKHPKVESTPDTKNAFQGLKVDVSKLFRLIEPKEFRPVETTLKDMVACAIEQRRKLHGS